MTLKKAAIALLVLVVCVAGIVVNVALGRD